MFPKLSGSSVILLPLRELQHTDMSTAMQPQCSQHIKAARSNAAGAVQNNHMILGAYNQGDRGVQVAVDLHVTEVVWHNEEQ